MLRLPERRTNYLKTCVNYKIDNIKIPDSSFDWEKNKTYVHNHVKIYADEPKAAHLDDDISLTNFI